MCVCVCVTHTHKQNKKKRLLFSILLTFSRMDSQYLLFHFPFSSFLICFCPPNIASSILEKKYWFLQNSLSLSLSLTHTHKYTPPLFSFYSPLFLARKEIFVDGNYMVVRVMNWDRKSLKFGIWKGWFSRIESCVFIYI